MNRFMQRYRYSVILLQELVRTDFKLRYQGSILGYLWSLLRPLFLFVILYFVFVHFFKIGANTPHFAIYLLLGIILWNYFVEVTNGSVGAIVGKGDLLRKLNFPKYIIILASSVSAFINLLLNLIVVFVFMLFDHVDLTANALLFIPIIIELFVFSIGVAFFLSALFVKFRDISYIWEVILQGAFYATPILYPLSLVPDKVLNFLMLNPMAQLIQDARYVLVTQEAAVMADVYGGKIYMWLIPITIVIAMALCGGMYFRSQSKNFAEDV